MGRRRRPSPRTRRRALPRPRLTPRAWGTLAALLLLLALPPTRRLLERLAVQGWRALAAARAAEAHDRVVAAYARRYGIEVALADQIERAARAEGVDPELGFRLVRVESGFVPQALSPVGAIGLTQLMLPTALELQPGITPAELYRPETNLRLGFRYFRRLLRYYRGDVPLALHAYNRGIGTVARIRASGGDPANGYAARVLGDAGASPVHALPAAPAPAPAPRVDELVPTHLPSGL